VVPAWWPIRLRLSFLEVTDIAPLARAGLPIDEDRGFGGSDGFDLIERQWVRVGVQRFGPKVLGKLSACQVS
jgi:hypothetical protein